MSQYVVCEPLVLAFVTISRPKAAERSVEYVSDSCPLFSGRDTAPASRVDLTKSTDHRKYTSAEMVVHSQRSFDCDVAANDENNSTSSNCPTTLTEKNIVDNILGLPTPSMSSVSSSSRSSLTTSSSFSSYRNMILFSSSSSNISKKGKKSRSVYKEKIDELKMCNMNLKKQHAALCQELEEFRAWVSTAPLVGMEHVTLAVDSPAGFRDDDCVSSSIKSSRSVFGKKVPRAEYQRAIEAIEAENEKIKTDSDRLQIAIHDLQQWFSSYPIAK